MMRFVGRERELRSLEEAYSSGSFQLQVIYGRRRVGKTALINRFIEGKEDARYFIAQQNSAQVNLEQLSRVLGTRVTYPSEDLFPGDDVFPESFIPTDAPIYGSFQSALETLFVRSIRERIIFVIDEYPYLAKSYPGISSLLQTLVDRYQESSRLFLILCGSSLSFMEHQVLGEKSPLYGRRTGQIGLRPFDYVDAARMLDARDPLLAIQLYGVVGGVPLYLRQLDASRDVAWNIEHRVMGPDSLLSIEPSALLLQEARKPENYKAVINAVSSGRVTPKEIQDATGLGSSSVVACLEELTSMRLVEKREPIGSGRRGKGHYVLVDNLFRFHYGLGLKYAAAAEQGMGGVAARTMMRTGEFDTYMGPAFEEVCRQWLMRQMAEGRVAFVPQAVGSWWGTPARGQAEEVDVVISGTGEGHSLLLGECKWRNEPVDVGVLEKLRERADYLKAATGDTPLYLFSKSGFTKGLLEAACADGRVHLVAAEEMLDV